MLSETTCPDTIGKSRLSARLVSPTTAESERAAKAGFAGKTSIFVTIVFAGIIAAGCSTTTYLSFTENNKEQIEQKLNDYEQDEGVGAEIKLSIKNGEEIKGELLSVRDSTITIITKHSATEDELANLTYPIITARTDEIKELTLEGSNYVLAGLGIGIAAGTGIGILIGSIIEGDSRGSYAGAVTAFSGVVGFIVGAIVGPIIGYNLSTEEFILQEIPPDYDISFLKPLARYPDEEPEYLKAIP